MAWRNIHTQPFNGSWRDVTPLLRAYLTPILVLLMISCFAASFTAFLRNAVASVRIVRAGAIVETGSFLTYGPLAYLFLGDFLFAVLFWSFFRSVLTCAGYVPHEPWQHLPHYDALHQRRVREQWVKQREWLEWNRYQQAMLRYLWHAQMRQLMVGMSAPVMHLQPPAQPAQMTAVGDAGAIQERLNASCCSHLHQHNHTSASGGGGGQKRTRDDATALLEASASDSVTGSDSRSESEDSAAPSGGKPATPLGDRHCVNSVAPVALAIRDMPRGANPFSVRELEADGSLRYCATCGQYKPDRSHHCRYCDRCTAQMDHHCFYLGSCVGLRNYKYFFLTISYGTACGWLCSAMLLHVYAALAEVHSMLQREPADSLYPPGHGALVATDFAAVLRECRTAAHFSQWWLLTPACMLVVNAFVFYLWTQHADLLWRGMTTLERMRQVSVERFLRNTDIQRYGRCAPQTSRLCAALEAAKERARCMFHRIDSLSQNEDIEYEKMMSREEAEGGRSRNTAAANGGLDYAYGPNLLGSRDDLGASFTIAERRAKHFRRLFGYPQHWWQHYLPLTPRHTGEQVGEAECTHRQAKEP